MSTINSVTAKYTSIFNKKTKSARHSASMLIIIIATMIISLCEPVRAAENEPARWQENLPTLSIMYGYDIPDMTEIYYNGEYLPYGENYSENEKIHMLMVNGGFVPYHNIIIKNGRAMVPAEVIEDIFGATVEFHMGSYSGGNTDVKRIEVSVPTLEIVFNLNIGNATINGEKHDVDAPAFFRHKSCYLPLRFIADAFNADVEYREYKEGYLFGQALNESQSRYFRHLSNFDIITIETNSKEKTAYSLEEGISLIKDAATQMYGKEHMYKYLSNEYDMHEIKYTHHDLGRYYVYVVEGFESEPIYFNKYTGEIFSSPGGSIPYFIVIEGFLYKPTN